MHVISYLIRAPLPVLLSSSEVALSRVDGEFSLSPSRVFLAMAPTACLGLSSLLLLLKALGGFPFVASKKTVPPQRPSLEESRDSGSPQELVFRWTWYWFLWSLLVCGSVLAFCCWSIAENLSSMGQSVEDVAMTSTHIISAVACSILIITVAFRGSRLAQVISNINRIYESLREIPSEPLHADISVVSATFLTIVCTLYSCGVRAYFFIFDRPEKEKTQISSIIHILVLPLVIWTIMVIFNRLVSLVAVAYPVLNQAAFTAPPTSSTSKQRVFALCNPLNPCEHYALTPSTVDENKRLLVYLHDHLDQVLACFSGQLAIVMLYSTITAITWVFYAFCRKANTYEAQVMMTVQVVMTVVPVAFLSHVPVKFETKVGFLLK